jgi:hypothetical protein
MITDFAVGAIFRVVDEATPIVERISRQVAELDTIINKARENLTALGVTGREALAPLSGSLKTVGTEFGEVNTEISSMSRRMTTATARANALAAALDRAGAAGAGIASVPLVGGAARGGVYARGARGHGGAGGGSPFHGSVSMPAPIGHIRASTGVGPGTMAAAAGAVGIFETLKQSMEPAHQVAMLKLLGLDEGQITAMQDQAWRTAQAVPGTTFGAALAAQGEMYSIVGVEGALKLSQPMAQLERVLGVTGKGGAGGEGYTLTRATELMGQLTDPDTHQVDLEKFTRFLDITARTSIASHGKITPKDWLGFAKQSGPAAAGLTEQGFLTEAAIMQAMGGLRAGTAAASIQREFAGGIMPQRIAKELVRLGIAKGDDFEIGRGGQVIAKTGAMKDVVKEFQADPRAAIMDIIIPAMERHGMTSVQDQSQEVYRLFATETGRREAYELIRGRVQIGQERERLQKGMVGADAMAVLQGQDPMQVTESFTAAFKNLLGALGGPMMQGAIPIMNGLASSMNAMAGAAYKLLPHPGEAPTATQSILGGALTWGAIGAGTGAVMGGVLGFFGAGPPGLVGGALLGGRLGGTYGAMLGAGVGGAQWMGQPAGNPFPPVTAAPGQHSGLFPRAPANAPINAQITVRAETDDPEGLAHKIAEKLAQMLSHATEVNQGQGEGVLSSPYTAGGAS